MSSFFVFLRPEIVIGITEHDIPFNRPNRVGEKGSKNSLLLYCPFGFQAYLLIAGDKKPNEDVGDFFSLFAHEI